MSDLSDGSGAKKHWHELPLSEVFARVEGHLEGLAEAEVTVRLEKYGPNRLRPPMRRSALARFLAQFNNLLIYVLLAAGCVTLTLAHWIDSAVIFGVTVINAVIGFVQEGKAEKALDAIRNLIPQHATVLRDDRRITVLAERLVPGDMVYLQSGDKVPADLRLVRVKGLYTQEAALTGESLAVEKTTQAVDVKASLGDRTCLAFSGTLVASGQGSGVVVATGDATEIGRISAMMTRVQPLATPLLRQLDYFGRWLTGSILAVAGATFLFGIVVRSYSATEMFLAAVGLAVAAIPEGLPAIMTIALAIGVQRMARRNAIIRHLPAVEALGSVTTICSDKTGTLTRNEMTVESVATSRHLFEVTGVGYAPVGGFLLDGAEVAVDHRPLLNEMTRGALLCSDATLSVVDEEWSVDGDPTEGALLALGVKAGWDPVFESKARPRSDVIPFESEHRFMATLHHDHEANGYIYVKGAPERILQMVDRQRSYDGEEPLDLTYWERRMEEVASRGQRVLAIATRSCASDIRELRFEDVSSGLTLLGIFGLADPPRQEALEAVAKCRAAGIRVKMITGDHAHTARAVGEKLGLGSGDGFLTGLQLDTMSDAELRTQVEDISVFARTSPEHKLRLVQAFQANDHVVAMTGDGVNDAPALKRADVGVAMGLKGTEAAREAAEMVLADDNFASIASAIEEGRTVYDNLKKAITFILPTNGGEALIIIAAILFGRLLPITPVQILWVNMITAVTLALALAFEVSEQDVMARPPRRPAEPLLSRFLVWRIIFVSLIILTGTFGLFLWEREHGASIEWARTVAVNTLVMFEVFYLLNTRRLRSSVMKIETLFGSRPVLIAIGLVISFQILFTYAPPFQLLFDTRSIDIGAWVQISLVASSIFFLVELEKAVLRRVVAP